MPEIDTSLADGATPEANTLVTSTPASQGATPQKPTLTLEEVLKRNAELEHSHSNAKEELERHRKKLSAYEKAEKEAEAAKKAAEEAQLSEIERVKKQFSELQSQHDSYTRQAQERIVRYEIESQARKLNIIDPDAAAKLLDWSELEFSDDGTPANAEKLLEKLVKNKPYLVQAQQQQAPDNQSTQQSPATPRTPAIPAMNPGRSQIPQPGSLAPGQRPTIEQAYQMSRDRK